MNGGDGFEGTLVWRPSWRVKPKTIDAAKELAIELLRENPARVLTFYDIVKRRMGLIGDAIPEALAEKFGDCVRMLRDARFQLRDEIEALGEFDLVICCADGTPAIAARGRHAEGFAVRGSATGTADEHIQFGLTKGKLLARIGRDRRSGVIDNRAEACARSLVDSLTTAIDRGPDVMGAPELDR